MPSTFLKKTKLPVSYNTWQCCMCGSSPIRPGKRVKHDARFKAQSRNYADVKGYDFRDNMNWPCRKSSSWTPSPYEIFELEKNGVYSKHKYYQLVKIYHPDRNTNGSVCEGLSHIERLERYRLVVQAHEILSDPVKRRAYDTSGAGWGATRTATRHSRGYTNGEGKQYGFGPDDDSSIFQNATWEDWERWHRRHEQPSKQDYVGTYMHPNAFASFVILLAVISGVLQATRAGQFTGSIEERAQAFTEETRSFLASRADHFQQNQIGGTGRVKHFLEKRDPSKYGLKDEEEEAYRQHFSNEMMTPMPNLKDAEMVESRSI